ncbi:murein biosynthesis integral membrane protein MurJ [Tichowtungia aerotolerans]|uniref:Probable lipid II flippase MurJ n=1 Tax=Tichowtungia aerotolerans TaxID=2697043 RepID=A0A6P1M480_9BACT|nr:murein biosynthesis integral membrane protein MurJ [Tichowtungia aerotolerans]QHI68651.1 murein biosynthesis integral membrane protein MurJ [Tichowtungia aerotolerans]
MDKGRILKSVGTVGSFTALSRFLGLARDVLMAGFFGTSLVMDAFVVAFTVPNLFRRLFGEGALSSAFVPVLVETRQKEGDPAAWKLVNRVLVLLAAVLTLITLAVILFAVLVPVQSEKAVQVLGLLKIMMPYMVFICLAAVSMGILNSFHHFAVSAFAPAILNILWISTVLFVVPNIGTSPEEKIRAVAWAVLLAGFLQWAVQWPMLYKLGWRMNRVQAQPAKVGKILRLMGPAALGMAVLQLNVVIDRTLALWVGGGAPSALFFSERLIYFPLGIIATALGTVLLPTFSGQAKDPEKMSETVSDSLRHLLFVMIPASVGLLVLATPVVQMIFEWKNFGTSSTWMTAIALQAYAPGLVVFSLAKVFVPAFYGMQDTRTPVRVGMIAVVLNLVLNITFVLTLPQAVKHAGLAFATVLSSVFNMSCLALILQHRLGGIGWKAVAATAARSFGAAALMGVAVWFVYGLFPNLGKIGQVIAVAVSIGIGGAAYLIASLLFRAPELREFVRTFRR